MSQQAETPGETDVVVDLIQDTTFGEIPTDVIDHGKRAIRDYLGVAIYGAHHDVGDRIVSFVQSQYGGTESTILGHGTSSAAGAALANGTFGHAIDFDDTFESIVIHPTSPVFAASLATAEQTSATGEEVLTGYVIGCEVAFRIGHSTYPDHYKNGWHATGTVGSFGAVAAAASILGLDSDQTARALGITASGSSSLKKNFGSMTKPLHAGAAAQTGVRAALLAQSGFTADPHILEGANGYGEVMTPNGTYDPTEITEGRGEWAVADIGFKPHPSGVITHAAMDALRTVVIDNDLDPEDVDSVTVTLDDAASEMLIHANPENALQAKFSIEFCLAAILRERRAGIHEFTDEYVTRPEVKTTIGKVERAFEPQLFDTEYAGYGARVIVETASGDQLTNEVRFAPGSPNNPLSEERLYAKFEECAETVLDESAIEQLATAIDTLEEPGSIDALQAAVRLS